MVAEGPASQRRKILVAVDGSDGSELAAEAAHRLFGDSAEYVLINVDVGSSTPLGDPLVAGSVPGSVSSGSAWPVSASSGSESRRLMDAVAEHAQLDHPGTLSATGDAAAAIMDAAHEHAVDMIVVGVHDRSWFSRLFDRSTGRHIVGSSDVPVLAVRHGHQTTSPTVHADGLLVMVATDGSAASLDAARTAWRIFGPQARYEVVHVAPERPDPNADATGFAGPLIDDEEADEIERETLVNADAVVAETAQAIGPVPITETVVTGDPVRRLCDRAEEAQADVLVIGSSGLSGVLHVLLGSISEHVLARCEVPVLVVPADSRR